VLAAVESEVLRARSLGDILSQALADAQGIQKRASDSNDLRAAIAAVNSVVKIVEVCVRVQLENYDPDEFARLRAMDEGQRQAQDLSDVDLAWVTEGELRDMHDRMGWCEALMDRAHDRRLAGEPPAGNLGPTRQEALNRLTARGA
jgi:tRNA threonylcarbamoyladenosine modification (KEOPS) complex  Pcc1 subunit